jgi:hypothetical protein
MWAWHAKMYFARVELWRVRGKAGHGNNLLFDTTDEHVGITPRKR